MLTSPLNAPLTWDPCWPLGGFSLNQLVASNNSILAAFNGFVWWNLTIDLDLDELHTEQALGQHWDCNSDSFILCTSTRIEDPRSQATQVMYYMFCGYRQYPSKSIQGHPNPSKSIQIHPNPSKSIHIHSAAGNWGRWYLLIFNEITFTCTAEISRKFSLL